MMFHRKLIESGRPIQIGVAGCGRIFEKHLTAIQQLQGDLELKAICDSDSKQLEKFAPKVDGVRSYTDFDKFSADPKLDLVVLCTPSGLHARQGMAAAEAGKHVITEKPMATNWAEGKKLVETCDKAGVHLLVVKQNRCNPTLRLLKEAVKRKRFGRIFSVQVNVFWSRPQSYYDSAAWRGTWEFDGGALMNQASHYVDLLDWLVGPVESVQSYTATLNRNIEVEDTGVAVVRWRSGALGTVNVTTLAPFKNIEGSIMILGEKGVVKIGGIALNKVEQWEFVDKEPVDNEVMTASYQPDSVYGNGHLPYYKNAIRALRGEERPETDGREGLRSLELIIATYIAARDAKRISLPLDY